MERLWAPWRMQYILSGDELSPSCIFCAYPDEGPTQFRKRLILCATDHAFVIMNKYPYNNGHVMVVPRSHASEPEALDAASWSGTGELVRASVAALKSAIKPQGLNLGMNLGRVAGAGIDQHLHWHIVPRWNGDTNFMPVVGEVKVLSENLDATYERLLPHFAALGVGPA
jgi:ATP adenylyltransferase